MRILAIDSSGLVATVAVVEGCGLGAKTVAEYTVNYKKTHSQTLLPMLDEIARMTELELETVDAIAVAGGPGSFTGLRIGSATAKGLGLALKKPLVHIPTVDALAYNLCFTDRLVCPIMDARRNQVYTGIYEFDGPVLRVLEPQMAVGIEELAGKLAAYPAERGIVFLGDGVPIHGENLRGNLLAGRKVFFAPPHLNAQRAAALGALALDYCLGQGFPPAAQDECSEERAAGAGRPEESSAQAGAASRMTTAHYQGGRIETAAEHRPEYLRVSQAERERAERLKRHEG